MPFPDARAASAALSQRSATAEDLREIVTKFPQLRPAVAAYPEVDQALLDWLADLHNPLVDAQLNKRAQTRTANRKPGPASVSTTRSGGSRPRWLIPAIAAALVLVLASGVFALVNSLSAPTTPAAVVTPSAPVATTGEPSLSATATPSPTPTPTPSAPAVTCWDGSGAQSLAECEAPSDAKAYWKYLRYAFPSIADHPKCVKKDSTGESTYTGVTVMWNCELGKALIRYRYWAEPQDAKDHYRRKFDKKTTLASYDALIDGEPAVGWIKTDKNTAAGPGSLKRKILTLWLPEHQLSVSIEGNTSKAMWAALKKVSIRPAAELLGHAVDEETPGLEIAAKRR